MFKTLEANQGKREYNPVWLMVDSGARGNKQQVPPARRFARPYGQAERDIIEKTDLANFREVIVRVGILHSTHGARKVWPTRAQDGRIVT